MTPIEFKALLDQQVLIIDGAMGTMVQSYNFGPEVYGGERYQMVADLLVFSRPEAVKDIHKAYLEAGAMAVETNTFGASELRLAEFDFSGLDLAEFPAENQDLNQLSLPEFAERLNEQAAQIAQKALDEYRQSEHYDGRPLLVLGSIGPSNWVLSPTHADLHKGSFEQIEQNFNAQAKGLIKGGADVLLFETQQDMLELKAAVLGAKRAMKELGRELAIIAQVTVDKFSKMQIFNTDVLAALVTLQEIGISAFGINCSIGPDQMKKTVEILCRHAKIPVSVVPNAGLPVSEGGQTVFKLGPEEFGQFLEPYYDLGVSIVGGCCGTSPAHIAQVAKRFQGKKPVSRTVKPGVFISGPQQAIEVDSSESLIRIGERLNVRGSKKVREAVETEGVEINQEVLDEVVKEQVVDLGLEVLDICMDSNVVNTTETLTAVIQAQCVDFSGAFCLDSFDVEALAEAIKVYPGRPIINSISLEEYAPGLDKVDAVLEVTKAHAPLYIALTTGPEGPALTTKQKIDLARLILEKAINKHHQKPEQFLVDINAFPIGSESDPEMNFAVQSIQAIGPIKALYPGVKTTIGVGNLTNGLAKKPYMRKVLTSVFLDEARKAGLDAAIVNPNHYVPVESLSEEDRQLGLKVILERDMDAFAELEEIAASKSGGPKRKKTNYLDLEPITALCQKIKDGFKERGQGQVDVFGFQYEYTDKIIETVAQIITAGIKPLVLINDHLMKAMEELGAGFAEGLVSLPHLLKSADVMKQVMGLLEAYMKAKLGASGEIPVKGTVVLGTVYQDVHSIGKDLTKTLMENYGYKVIDLGVQVPLQRFIDVALEHRAGVIGCSALLVQTSNHMISLSKLLLEQGLAEKIDLLVGGAPVSFKHAAQVALAGEEDPHKMRPNVFYCASAMDGINVLSQLGEPKRKAALLTENKKRMIQAFEGGRRRANEVERLLRELPYRVLKPLPAVDLSLGLPVQVVRYKMTDFVSRLNKTLLFTLNWKYGGKGGWAKKGVDEKQLLDQLVHWAEKAEQDGWIEPQGVCGLFPARAVGQRLLVYSPDGTTERAQFDFNDVVGRQKKDKFNLAHYFPSDQFNWVGLQLSTAGSGLESGTLNMKDEDSETAWMLQGLSDRVAEDMAMVLHQRLNEHLGLQDSSRYSPGYPAMNKIQLNQPIFELLQGEQIGVSVTDGFEFAPTSTTAALVCFHPEAGYH